MKIKLNSIVVDDQEKALAFYTEKLGFILRTDIPMGEYRWLTVAAADEPDGTELVLEPNAHPAAAAFQKAMFESGIPLTALASDDIDAEHELLVNRGVRFRQAPIDAGGTRIAMFEDTCGNLIQIYQALS